MTMPEVIKCSSHSLHVRLEVEAVCAGGVAHSAQQQETGQHNNAGDLQRQAGAGVLHACAAAECAVGNDPWARRWVLRPSASFMGILHI